MNSSGSSIGLIGSHDDDGLRMLEAALLEREATVRRIELRKFPQELALSVDSEGIFTGQASLRGLGAIYVGQGETMSPIPDWMPSKEAWPSLKDSIREEVRRHQESRSVRGSVLNLLSAECHLVNPPAVHRACRLLPQFLRQLSAAGLPVAPYVSGNDLEKMAYFVDEHGEQCQVRRLWDPPWAEEQADFEFLKKRHLDLDRFPLLVRRRMGRGRLHAVVVGNQCVGMVRRVGGRWQPLEEEPAEAARVAVRSVAEVDGFIAVVHLELDDKGDAWLLGMDPEPKLAPLEKDCRLNVVSALADLLIQLADSAPAGRPQKPLSASSPQAVSSGSGTRVGIVGQAGNSEVVLLARALSERGAEPTLMEFPLFPQQRTLHECAEGGRSGVEEFAGLDAIFLRTSFAHPPHIDERRPPGETEEWLKSHSEYCRKLRDEGECFAFKYAVLEILGRRIPVINPPLAQEVHRTKVSQLFSLMRAGLPVPPTEAGNDPEACRRFVEAQGGEERVVLKPLAGIYKTCLLSEVGLEKALEAGPVLLQRYIQGDTIRAYLVGGELKGAARILYAGGSVDSSVGQTGVERVELPGDAVNAGWAAAQHLGLAWTGMDFLRETQTGSHFILECNAAPMFAGFSYQTGLDIAGALADFLLELAQT